MGNGNIAEAFSDGDLAMRSEEDFIEALSTFLDKTFTKATLLQVCHEKVGKASPAKSAIINECLRSYTPKELMRRLNVVQRLPWHEKLVVACLLGEPKSVSEMLDAELARAVLAKALPEAAFLPSDSFEPERLLPFNESMNYFRRHVYKLKKKGLILLNPRTRTYRLNPLASAYFSETLSSISAEELSKEIEEQVSAAIADINERSGFPIAGEGPPSLIMDIGEGFWSSAPFNTWVSKTDIVQFLRCKYRVYLMYQRNLDLDEVRDPRLIRSLLEKGRQFENTLIAQTPFEEVASLESVMDKDVIFRTPRLIQNHEIGIRGIVDLIQTERGKLYPIEIKYHRNVSDVDRLELALYWTLLDPLRKGSPNPKGYILLNTGEVVEVTLTNKEFVDLNSLIREIREVKEVGMEPVLCKECAYCRLRDECSLRVRNRGGLTCVHGVGPIRNDELQSLGIKDTRALAAADTENLQRVWRQLTPHAPSLSEIREMQIHIRSLDEGRAIYFGSSDIPVGNKVLVLDLEYDNSTCVWLAGLLACDAQGTDCYQLFADEVQDEKENLIRFMQLLQKHPGYQILTWDGLRADIPQLGPAWRRHQLPSQELEDLKQRHLDLYNFFLHNYRFPLVSFGLKEVGRYLGFNRKYGDMDGLEAQMLYHQYLSTPKHNRKKRANIKHRLLEYNKEDLEATLFVLDRLRALINT